MTCLGVFMINRTILCSYILLRICVLQNYVTSFLQSNEPVKFLLFSHSSFVQSVFGRTRKFVFK